MKLKNNHKKLISFIVILSMMTILFASTVTALPENTINVNKTDVILLAVDYAYMDLDTASVELKSKILEARKEIIMSESWTIDGFFSTLEDDGTLTPFPEFYDVFPADWEIPTVDATVFSSNARVANSPTRGDVLEGYGWTNNVQLRWNQPNASYSSFLSVTPQRQNPTPAQIKATAIQYSPYMYNAWCVTSSGTVVGYAADKTVGNIIQTSALCYWETYYFVANTNFSSCIGLATINVKYAY